MGQKLPELIGSPDQVRWATNIRARFVAAMASDIRQLERSPHNAHRRRSAFEPVLRAKRQYYDDLLMNNRDAQFWIERRGRHFLELAIEQAAIQRAWDAALLKRSAR